MFIAVSVMYIIFLYKIIHGFFNTSSLDSISNLAYFSISTLSVKASSTSYILIYKVVNVEISIIADTLSVIYFLVLVKILSKVLSILQKSIDKSIGNFVLAKMNAFYQYFVLYQIKVLI